MATRTLGADFRKKYEEFITARFQDIRKAWNPIEETIRLQVTEKVEEELGVAKLEHRIAAIDEEIGRLREEKGKIVGEANKKIPNLLNFNGDRYGDPARSPGNILYMHIQEQLTKHHGIRKLRELDALKKKAIEEIWLMGSPAEVQEAFTKLDGALSAYLPGDEFTKLTSGKKKA